MPVNLHSLLPTLLWVFLRGVRWEIYSHVSVPSQRRNKITASTVHKLQGSSASIITHSLSTSSCRNAAWPLRFGTVEPPLQSCKNREERSEASNCLYLNFDFQGDSRRALSQAVACWNERSGRSEDRMATFQRTRITRRAQNSNKRADGKDRFGLANIFIAYTDQRKHSADYFSFAPKLPKSFTESPYCYRLSLALLKPRHLGALPAGKAMQPGSGGRSKNKDKKSRRRRVATESINTLREKEAQNSSQQANNLQRPADCRSTAQETGSLGMAESKSSSSV